MCKLHKGKNGEKKMKFTEESILKNTEPKTLFNLFKRYTDSLVLNCQDSGIFAVDDDVEDEDQELGALNVFANSDIRKTIKQIKRK